MKKAKNSEVDDMRPEYSREELGKGVRGKYYAAYHKGSNIVVLRPDIAKAFPTSEAVNEALHGLLQLTEQTHKLTRRTRPSRVKRTKVSKEKPSKKARPSSSQSR